MYVWTLVCFTCRQPTKNGQKTCIHEQGTWTRCSACGVDGHPEYLGGFVFCRGCVDMYRRQFASAGDAR